MLARAAEEEARSRRGRLKVFFGMAPGVGKTYAMLENAQARRAEGVDVVLGWVNTHGRRDTEVLTVGLERLPPRVAEHRGIRLEEFDLDAALTRRPGLLLVDELPHSNATGSRHAHRWQDVEELVHAGIDVFTTLNVQHLESLNDVVAIITGVAILETVPDSIVDGADEVELVDLSPDDLLQRFREGKVYVPAQAERAMQNFFRERNLVALRELALRRTAEHVGLQADRRRARGATKAWPTRELVVVAVGPGPRSVNVVRAASRMAGRLRAPWIAVAVESRASDRLAAVDRARLAANLALAERLGAETLSVRGERAADEILAVAREHNATRIVVGRPADTRWRGRLRRSLVDELVRRSETIDVIVTAGEESDQARSQPLPAPRSIRPRQYLDALLGVAVATLACWLTRNLFTLADQAMIYLLGVLILSSRLSRGPSVLAAIASVAALDFFFVPPQFTFEVADLRYLATFAVMLIVALTVSGFALRVRMQADEARQRERRTAALYTMSREFAVETEPGEIAATAVCQVRELLATDSVVFVVQADGALAPLAGAESPLASAERELAVARWVFENGQPAGRGTDTLPAAEALCLPLVGSRRTLGVLAVHLGRLAAQPSPGGRQLLETYAAQTALALERALLAEEAARSRVAAETERTRSSLLSLVSHDLRTPLASITGAASVLLREGVGEGERRELVETIRGEGERLGRLLSDLLDLTRFESGVSQVHKEWSPIEEIVGAALSRVESKLEGRDVITKLPEEVLLVPLDALLIEQVLLNLLENAAKYSPAGSPLEIGAAVDAHDFVVRVADRGPGIAPGQEERVFERFYRAADGTRAAGTGLGLAVCRAIVRAHGGSIRAENRPDGGALFSFRLPIEGAPPSLETLPEAREPEARG
jgi:two-component system sensor histidine kinase KdpD